jgi:hypothetical protein
VRSVPDIINHKQLGVPNHSKAMTASGQLILTAVAFLITIGRDHLISFDNWLILGGLCGKTLNGSVWSFRRESPAMVLDAIPVR